MFLPPPSMIGSVLLPDQTKNWLLSVRSLGEIINVVYYKFILFRRSDEKNVTVNVPQNVTVNKTEQAVFALLREHPEYTRDELAEKTSKTVRTIQRTVDSLREKGLIERIGSDKTGQWKIIEQEVQ